LSDVKIATFNINNINRRLPNLLRWLQQAKPDVVALQELKSTDADFPLRAIEKAGYGAVWRGQKTWNGVAILARKADPVLIRTALPGDPDDKEARYIEAAVRGIMSPAFTFRTAIRSPVRNSTTSSNGSGGSSRMPRKFLKQDIRRAGWRLQRRANRARYLSDQIMGQGCADPAEEPRRLQILVAQGWLDAIRERHPSKPMFTFWDYKRNRWPRDAGLRLDHLLLSPVLAPRLIKAGVDAKERAEEGASDHAPAWIVLR